MRIIYNPLHDPAYNLAMEEVMFNGGDDVAMLWRNSPAVIIGRNQNAFAEIDTDFVRENNVSVIRRMTGGGAVFHDLGNINFTFIRSCSEDEFNNYDLFTLPVRDYLRSLGAECELSGRNDLTLGGMKISGNAQTVRRGRILHHGTLLFDSDLSRLAGSLRVRDIKVESRGIRSHRSRVTNINDHLAHRLSPEEFLDGLLAWFTARLPDAVRLDVTPEEDAAARRLATEKYGRWEWNFGESPHFDLHRAVKYDFGVVEASVSVENGLISAAAVNGDFFGKNDVAELAAALIGVRHERGSVTSALSAFDVGEYISGMTTEELAALIV